MQGQHTSKVVVIRDDALRKAVSARLKEQRKLTNWSRKALIGIRRQQLNKHESGLNIPPTEMQVKHADALAVSVDFLRTGNPVEDTPLANSLLFSRFQAIEALAPDNQETVIRVIYAMLAKQRIASALTPVDATA